MKTSIQLRSILLTTSMLIGASPAHAAFVDHNTYTTDTTTGLDWLDVTATVNISKTAMLSLLAPGQAYQGWRYATQNDFDKLVSDYTNLPVINHVFDNWDPSLILGLNSLLGVTLPQVWDQHSVYDTYGYLLETDPQDTKNSLIGFVRSLSLAFWDINDMVVVTQSYASSNTYYSTDASRYTGSYLVRDTQSTVTPPAAVPVPAAFPLMLSGLGLLGLGFRKRQAIPN